MGAEVKTDRAFYSLDHIQQCDLAGLTGKQEAAVLAADGDDQPRAHERSEDLRKIRLPNVTTGTDVLKGYRAFAVMLGQDAGSADCVICRR